MSVRQIGRGRGRARLATLYLSTFIAPGLAVPALAQQSPYDTTDANGVELTDGSFNLDLPVYTIGSGEAALSLSIQSTLFSAPDNWSSTYLTQQQSGSGYFITVVIGNDGDNFYRSGGATTLTSTRATGATLTIQSANTYVYPGRPILVAPNELKVERCQH